MAHHSSQSAVRGSSPEGPSYLGFATVCTHQVGRASFPPCPPTLFGWPPLGTERQFLRQPIRQPSSSARLERRATWCRPELGSRGRTGAPRPVRPPRRWRWLRPMGPSASGVCWPQGPGSSGMPRVPPSPAQQPSELRSVGSHPLVKALRALGEGRGQRGYRRRSRKETGQRLQGCPRRVHAAVGHDQVPRGHPGAGVYAGEKRLCLGVLKGDGPEPPAPIPGQQAIQRPPAEAAFAVVEDHRLTHPESVNERRPDAFCLTIGPR
jgi:hypothetical protein